MKQPTIDLLDIYNNVQYNNRSIININWKHGKLLSITVDFASNLVMFPNEHGYFTNHSNNIKSTSIIKH